MLEEISLTFATVPTEWIYFVLYPHIYDYGIISPGVLNVGLNDSVNIPAVVGHDADCVFFKISVHINDNFSDAAFFK